MLRILLFPFSILYDLITRARNYLYDNGLKPSAQFDVPVISVGNLTVGGTGKTPMVEYLIRLLSPVYNIATLSRGYGRTSKGFRLATPDETALTLGDEPFQLFKKYGHKITVSVGEDRAFAVPNILQQRNDIEVILLDDAFQHRRIKPSLNILLSDYNRPFYTDFLLPAGRLRESRYNASRADVVVITKCPAEISDDATIEIEKSVREYVEKPVFFSSISYGNALPFDSTRVPLTQNVILLTGIADAKPLRSYVQQHFNLIKHIAFSDHHRYSATDLNTLHNHLAHVPHASFLTTEKDKVKLEAEEFKVLIAKLPLFYLPIELIFLKNGGDFDEIVLGELTRGERKNKLEST